jgi:integrase/recombinase XerD
VAALLASCDQDTGTGRRDFAMLTMLARLGLRAEEVAALALDDISWRAGEVTVRGKGSRAERLPLPADTGEAITAYLRDGRPEPFEAARQMFLRARAPHRGLTSGGVTRAVFAAGQRAGIGAVFAHQLRHSAAAVDRDLHEGRHRGPAGAGPALAVERRLEQVGARLHAQPRLMRTRATE